MSNIRLNDGHIRLLKHTPFIRFLKGIKPMSHQYHYQILKSPDKTKITNSEWCSSLLDIDRNGFNANYHRLLSLGKIYFSLGGLIYGNIGEIRK